MVARFNDNLTGWTFTRRIVLRLGDKPKHWLCGSLPKKDREDILVALTAFHTARAASAPIADCYLAAVRAIHRLYPECARECAGQRAVAIILESRVPELIGRSTPLTLKSKDEELRP